MRTSRGGYRSGALAAMAAAVALMAAVASGPVVGGMLQSVVPNYPVKAGPAPWNVGDTFNATLTLGNSTFTTPATMLINVDTILFTPSCGFSSADGICDTVPDATDQGVFQFGTGTGAGACTGRTFTTSVADAATGELLLTPSSVFTLGSADQNNGQLLCTITIPVTVLKVPAIDADSVAGKTLGLARASFSSGTGGPVPPLVSATFGGTSALVTGPSLTIKKTAQASPINAGATAQFTIEVDNTAGTGAATDVKITDTLTNFGTTWALNPAVAGCAVSAGNPQVLSCTTLTVPAGQKVSLVLQAPTDNSACPGELSNTVSLTGANGFVYEPPKTAQASLACQVITADLSISKTDGKTTYTPGLATTYTIVVSNAGPTAVTGAPVTDTLPAQVSSAAWTCTASAGSSCGAASGTGSIATTVNLLMSGTATFVVTAQTSPAATGDLTNGVTVMPPVGVIDPNLSNNTATDTDAAAPVANLTILKTDGKATVTLGGQTTYTVTVTNTGPSSVTGAKLVDLAVAGLTKTAVACASVPGVCVTAPTVAQIEAAGGFALPTLAPGQTYAVAVTATVTALGGSVSNTATVTPPPGTSNPGTSCLSPAVFNAGACSSTDTNTVVLFTYTVVKAASSPSLAPNSPLTFTITVTNNGPSDASGSILKDPAIAGFTAAGVSCTGSAGGAACPAGVSLANLQGSGVTLTSLPAGGQLTFTLTGTFTATSGSISNSAQVCPVAGVDQNLCSTGTTTVTVFTPVEVIPTLSEYALLALMLLLATLGAGYLRRPRR